MKYQVIVTNIETFDKVDGGFNKLWKHEPFTSCVISIIWDEGQCVSKWANFHPEYKTAGWLCHLIPRHILFYVTSATLPPVVLQDITDTLHIRTDSTYLFERSNDWPILAYVFVRWCILLTATWISCFSFLRILHLAGGHQSFSYSSMTSRSR